MTDAKNTQEIVEEIHQIAQQSQQFSEETKNLVSLLSNNLCADIHNYFVSLVENVARPESGFTAEQLNNASKDLAHILSTVEVIINRHKNFIVYGDPDRDIPKSQDN